MYSTKKEKNTTNTILQVTSLRKIFNRRLQVSVPLPSTPKQVMFFFIIYMYVTCTHVKMGLHLCACVETRDWHQVSSSITILFSGTFLLDWLGNHLEFSYLYFPALRLQEGITGPFGFFHGYQVLMLRQQLT